MGRGRRLRRCLGERCADVSRKTKIRIAVVFIVFGLIAWAIWPAANQGEVRVAFAGISMKDTNVVLFVLTNSSRTPVEYFQDVISQTNGIWQESDGSVPPPRGGIMGQNTLTVHQPIVPANRWRVQIEYADSFDPSLVGRIRESLSAFASGHGWNRLGSWFNPKLKLRFASGPEMLGNQPALPTQP